MRLRARFAWWVFDRISDWLDAPDMTEEELEQAEEDAAREARFEAERYESAERDGYWQGFEDARNGERG